MYGLDRQLLGLGLVVTGCAMLVSPIRRHRAVWQVTVGDEAPRSRVLHGGERVPAASVILSPFRSGDRRRDAEFRSAVGLALIGFGLGLSLTRGES